MTKMWWKILTDFDIGWDGMNFSIFSHMSGDKSALPELLYNYQTTMMNWKQGTAPQSDRILWEIGWFYQSICNFHHKCSSMISVERRDYSAICWHSSDNFCKTPMEITYFDVTSTLRLLISDLKSFYRLALIPVRLILRGVLLADQSWALQPAQSHWV